MLLHTEGLKTIVSFGSAFWSKAEINSIIKQVTLLYLSFTPPYHIQKCRQIRRLGCVNQALTRVQVTQPSPDMFLYICTQIFTKECVKTSPIIICTIINFPRMVPLFFCSSLSFPHQRPRKCFHLVAFSFSTLEDDVKNTGLQNLLSYMPPN